MSWEIFTTSGLAVMVAGSTYWMQKHFDRRESMRARHYNAYIQMMDSLAAMAIAHEFDEGEEVAVTAYSVAKMKFAVVASDTAMAKLADFDRLMVGSERAPQAEFNAALLDLMREVRRENLGVTKTSDDDLLSVTPFGKTLPERLKE